MDTTDAAMGSRISVPEAQQRHPRFGIQGADELFSIVSGMCTLNVIQCQSFVNQSPTCFQIGKERPKQLHPSWNCTIDEIFVPCLQAYPTQGAAAAILLREYMPCAQAFDINGVLRNFWVRNRSPQGIVEHRMCIRNWTPYSAGQCRDLAPN